MPYPTPYQLIGGQNAITLDRRRYIQRCRLGAVPLSNFENRTMACCIIPGEAMVWRSVQQIGTYHAFEGDHDNGTLDRFPFQLEACLRLISRTGWDIRYRRSNSL